MNDREKIVAEINHRFILLKENGEEIPINLDMINQQTQIKKDFPELVKLINFEVLGKKPGIIPPSIKLMRNMELIDYEPASDSGHFRFYPKGALMLKLLEDWAEEIAVNRFGAMQIESPILYDWNHQAIRSQGESFHERHYVVHVPEHPEKEFVLRFAGDFGLFCMVSDANISYRNLPLRIYEFSKSFRYERSGELVGLRRLRAFSMPDIHSFCEDINQSWEEYKKLYKNYADLADAMNIEYGIIFRIVDSFYKKYKDQILLMLEYSKKPCIVDILSEMKHYWAVKHEFQGLDSIGGACQLSTVQLDVEDAEKYNIIYTNQQGKEQGCVICHSSIGALERWIFLILETAQKTDIPQFPLWLSPIQVRVIPVSKKFNEFAIQIAFELKNSKIRVDVDDRSKSVGNRIRIAEKEWTPYILVVGQKEKNSMKLSVKKRDKKTIIKMEIKQFIEVIRKKIDGMPFRQSSLPILLSRRPIFYG